VVQGDSATAGDEIVDEAEFRALAAALRTSTARGPLDRRGALGNLRPEHTLAALDEVRSGRSVSLASPVELEETVDNPHPWDHRMSDLPGGDDHSTGLSFAADAIALHIHGDADTHIDALCHVAYDGRLYNDVPADVVGPDGATELSIDLARDGIVGRGVLLDIPRLRGVPWLEPGEHVTYDELVEAERAQGLTVGDGDLLLVRVGHRRRRAHLGPWDAAAARAGLHPRAVPFAAERRVAMLGSDGNNDTAPSVATTVEFPVHVLAIQVMGLQLLDYLQLEELATQCADRGSWAFLCVVAPLRLPTATGSPINPIAVL
jgi:kynurenine formamidase